MKEMLEKSRKEYKDFMSNTTRISFILNIVIALAMINFISIEGTAVGMFFVLLNVAYSMKKYNEKIEIRPGDFLDTNIFRLVFCLSSALIVVLGVTLLKYLF